MTYVSGQAAQREELARVDYFLDQLARAVERDEVPRASYDTLAPRYLARRAVIVEQLSRPEQVQPPTFSATAASTLSARPAKSPPKPVDWTTILLFLGAFLVIAASAIFAVTVWDVVGPLAKLAFMAALTVGFYVAGFFARTKLHLRAGSAALTVVGSAMLLFDAWIVISGYSLEGPLPWAIALLLISAVYWYTEVRLGDRFYGAAGAAAQVGWWWLMGAGLHLEVSVRLAGIAVVALVWQLAAERVREDATWSSLGRMLLWAAPIVELLAALGITFNAATTGTPTWSLVISAAVVATSGAIVVWRNELIGRGREWIAGAAQIPLFIVLFLPGTASWPGVALLVSATVCYALFSLYRAGIPFAAAALVAEILAVSSVGSLLGLDQRVVTALMAVLALSWVIASRLAETPSLVDRSSPLRGVRGFAVATLVGGFALLVAASCATVVFGAGVPLGGAPIPSSDVLLYGAVLACWALASLVRRDALFASVASAWSFLAFAASLAWAVPTAHSTGFALALVLLAATWLALKDAMERFFGLDRVVFGWVMRGVALAFVVGGLVAEMFYYSTISSWHGVLLVFGAALIFAADTAFGGPLASGSIATILLVFGAFLAGGQSGSAKGQAILSASAAATVLSVLGAWLRSRSSRQAAWVALAAAGAGTLACASGSLGEWALAGGFALVAASWVAAGFALRDPRLSFPGGLAVFAAVVAAVAAVDPSSWAAIAILGATGIALGSFAFMPGAGPGDSHSGLGAGFALAGLLGLVWTASIRWAGSLLWVHPVPEWSAVTQQGLVVALLLLGGYIVAQATRWRLEVGLYLGWGVFLLAACAEVRAADLGVIEWYSTAIGIYLIAMGYLYGSRDPRRVVPPALDVAAVAVSLGVPVWLTFASGSGSVAFTHTAWAVLLALLFVGGGIVFKVRAYLFAGAGALVLVTGFRSVTYLATFWWLVLGLIGMAMLVIALTWERQRQLISETQRRLKDSFENWR